MRKLSLWVLLSLVLQIYTPFFDLLTEKAEASGEVIQKVTLNYGSNVLVSGGNRNYSTNTSITPSIQIDGITGKLIKSIKIAGTTTEFAPPSALGKSAFSGVLNTALPGVKHVVISRDNASLQSYWAWYRYTLGDPHGANWYARVVSGGPEVKCPSSSSPMETVGAGSMLAYPGCSSSDFIQHLDAHSTEINSFKVQDGTGGTVPGDAIKNVFAPDDPVINDQDVITGPDSGNGTTIDGKADAYTIHNPTVSAADGHGFTVQFDQDFDYASPYAKELGLPGAKLMVYFFAFKVTLQGETYEYPTQAEITYKDAPPVLKPDLTPTTLTAANACLEIGTSQTFSFKLVNIGVTTTQSFRVSVRVDGSEIKSYTYSTGLAQNAEQAGTFDYTFSSTTAKGFTIVVDADNAIDEGGGESNNTLPTKTFTPQSSCSGPITPPDDPSIDADFTILRNRITYKDFNTFTPTKIVVSGCNYSEHYFELYQNTGSPSEVYLKYPSHTNKTDPDGFAYPYQKPFADGTITVMMIVKSDCGKTKAVMKSFVIDPLPNTRPSLEIAWVKSNDPATAINTAILNDALTLKVMKYNDPDGDPVTFDWFFNQSSSAWVNALPSTKGWSSPYSASQYTNITANTVGNHMVCAVARDNRGGVSPNACASVTVEGPEPVPVITGASTVKENRPMSPPLSAASSYSPVPGRSIDHSRDMKTNWQNAYSVPGNYNVTLEVFDNTGLKSLYPAVHPLNVTPDYLPIPSLTFPLYGLRNNNMDFNNTSYSPDGDVIVNTTVNIYYDSDNNGTYETWAASSSGNGSFTRQFTKVGKYRSVIYALEDWGKNDTKYFDFSIVNDNPEASFAFYSNQDEPTPPNNAYYSPNVMLGWAKTVTDNWRGYEFAISGGGNLTTPSYFNNYPGGVSPYHSKSTEGTAGPNSGSKVSLPMYPGSIPNDKFDKKFNYELGPGSCSDGSSTYEASCLSTTDDNGEPMYTWYPPAYGNVQKPFVVVSHYKNGTLLWTKEVPTGGTIPDDAYINNPQAYITMDADGRTVYILYPVSANTSSGIAKLDGATGNILGTVNWYKPINQLKFLGVYKNYVVTTGFSAYTASGSFYIQTSLNFSATNYRPIITRDGYVELLGNGPYLRQSIITGASWIPYDSWGSNFTNTCGQDTCTAQIDYTDLDVDGYGYSYGSYESHGDDGHTGASGGYGYVYTWNEDMNESYFPYGHLVSPVVDKNYELSYQMKFTYNAITQKANAGLDFRIQNFQTFYRVEASTSHLALVKYVGGARTVLRSIAYNFNVNQFYSFKMKAYDANIKVYLNGTPYIDLNDSSILTAGSFGPYTTVDKVELSGISARYYDSSGGTTNTVADAALVNDAVIYVSGAAPYYSDPENDPIAYENWKIVHTNPYKYIDIGDGLVGNTGMYYSKQLSFSRVGEYQVTYTAVDDPAPVSGYRYPNLSFDEYRKSSYPYVKYVNVHRKPVSFFRPSINPDGTVAYDDQSYDVDHCTVDGSRNVNYCQSDYGTNHGIFYAKYYYIDPNGSMVPGKLVRPTMAGVYTLAKASGDEFKAWSDYYETTITISSPPAADNPPSVTLTFPNGGPGNPSPVTLQPTITWNQWDPDSGTVYTTFDLEIRDAGGTCYECTYSRSMNTTNSSWAWTMDMMLQNGGTYQVRVRVSDGEKWSAWSNVGWMITNRQPSAYMSNPYGTLSNPTILNTVRPQLSWSQTDPDPGTTFTYFQTQVSDVSSNVILDSGNVWEGTTSTTGYWTVNANLPAGVPLQARVRVTDGFLWSNWSPDVWMLINRPPAASLTWPVGTQASPTMIASSLPTITWNQSDPDAGAQFYYFQVLVANEANTSVIMDSGKIWQGTLSANGSWTVSGNLPAGQKLRVRVRVWDQYDAVSNWSPDGWLYINRPPAGNITFVTPIYENDTPAFTVTQSDPEGDALTITVESSYSGGGYSTIQQWTAVPSGQTKAFVYGPLSQGDYSLRLTLNDGRGGTFQQTYSFTVLPLSITGFVTHTPEWESYRHKWNADHPGSARAANDFWAGEAFILNAAVTNTGTSATKPTSVTSTLLSTSENVTLATSNQVNFSGQLLNTNHDRILASGGHTFRFTVRWSNGLVQTYDAPVTIKGTIWDVIVQQIRH